MMCTSDEVPSFQATAAVPYNARVYIHIMINSVLDKTNDAYTL